MTWMEDDITFCNGLLKVKLNEEITHEVKCPIMNKCHRNVNQPKEHPWMSVFVEAPYNFKKNNCEFYWVITREKKIKSRKKK